MIYHSISIFGQYYLQSRIQIDFHPARENEREVTQPLGRREKSVSRCEPFSDPQDRILCKTATRVPLRQLGRFTSCSVTVISLRISFNSKGRLGYYTYNIEDNIPSMPGAFLTLSRESCRRRFIVGLSAIVLSTFIVTLN